MARKKYAPTKEGGSIVVDLPLNKGGVCENKLFFAQRLKNFRTAAHISQAELAERIGLASSSVGNWELGRTRPDIANIPLICTALGITISEFFSDSAPSADLSRDELSMVMDYRGLSEPSRIVIRTTMSKMLEVEEKYGTRTELRTDLKVLYWAHDTVAAGTSFGENEGVGEPTYVYDTPLTRNAEYVFMVSGDSMEPKFHDKDLVLVEKTTEIQQGQVGIFEYDGELLIKEYRKDGLHSYNKKYEPRKFHESVECKVIGRVLGKLDQDDLANKKEIELYQRENKR